MFWTKPKYIDNHFGVFEYSGGYWHVKANTCCHGKISISVDGSKKSPSGICLYLAKKNLTNIDSYIEKAKLYMESKEVVEFTKGNRDFVFDGFHCRHDARLVDFDFGITGWDDASIVVHFKDSKSYDVSLDD